MRRTFAFIVILTGCVSLTFAQDNAAQGPKPARVEITPHLTETEVGKPLVFSAVGYDEAGNKIDAKPSAWFAAPFDVGYADDQGNVTFVQPGEARIGALINGKAGYLTVIVNAPPVARVDCKPLSGPIPVGTGVLLSAVTGMANGDPRTDVPVTWSSLNSNIATIDESGFVTAVAPGTATIQATAAGVKGSVSVEVIRNPVARLLLSPG
jgi:hypothetical protein